jgi:hypothetical protein
MKTSYASLVSDGLALSARNHFIGTGVVIHTIGSNCPVTDILESEAFKAEEVKLVLLFECKKGHYRSNHYRILTKKDVEHEGFVIPEWAPAWGSYVTDRVVYVALQRHETPKPAEHFRIAMEDLFHRTSGMPRPKPKKKEPGGYRERQRKMRARIGPTSEPVPVK